MSDKLFLVTKTHIVKAKNMKHARGLVEGDEDIPGSVMADNLFAKEVSEDQASMYFSTGQDSFYNTFDEIEEEEIDNQQSNESNIELARIAHPERNITDSTIDFLRSENKRLARLADKHKNVRNETVNAIYAAAYDAFSNVNITVPEKKELKRSGQGDAEVAVAVFADWQLGKLTPDYDSEVLAQRIELYTEKMLKIVEMQRADHPVDTLHVWLLGDIVEGEEIFPGQSHLLDSGLYRQVGINGPEVLSKFLTTALQNFSKVNVTGVIGNHGSVGGRNRKMYDPESNMDRLLYRIVSLIFRNEPRITFNIPDGRGERHWYAVDRIGSYGSLLIHGDQMPSPNTVTAYYRKVMGWKDGAIPEEFEDVFMGHYHQQAKMTIGTSTLRISGSPESTNTYAQEYFNSMSRPSQHLMFVHPNNGVTSEYSIWLDTI
jgi:hypothetical protein